MVGLDSYSGNLKSKTCPELRRRIQIRKLAGFLAIVVTLTMCGAVAEAQQAKKVPRIGFLAPSSSAFITPLVEAFRQGLRELGWIEGHNITIDYRWAEGNPERLPDLAAELVRLKVDVIVTAGEPAVRPAQQATKTIPIVMAASSDPIGSGLVASLARPGGNTTGLSAMTRELNLKRLELFKTAVPGLTRVAVLRYSGYEPHTSSFKELETAAPVLGVKLQSLELSGLDDLDRVFDSAKKGRAGGLILLRHVVILSHQTQLARVAAKYRLPSIFDNSDFVLGGCLMSYGANNADLYRRAAVYVDKILKGTKPTDLPVEQPMNFELIINLKTAKQIGVTIEPNHLARANKVIR